MPLLAGLIFVCILSNFGFPGTINFVGEFLILLAGVNIDSFFIICSFFGLILTLIYSLFLYNRIFFGKINFLFFKFYSDIIRLEFILLLFFVLNIIIFGFFPNWIIKLVLINLLKFLIIF